MTWQLLNNGELMEEIITNHSILLDDAIELSELEKIDYGNGEKPESDFPDYVHKATGMKVWYDDLDLELK